MPLYILVFSMSSDFTFDMNFQFRKQDLCLVGIVDATQAQSCFTKICGSKNTENWHWLITLSCKLLTYAHIFIQVWNIEIKKIWYQYILISFCKWKCAVISIKFLFFSHTYTHTHIYIYIYTHTHRWKK